MKIVFLIILYTLTIFNQETIPVLAKSNYARAVESTNLYRYNDSDSISNVICIVEKSYFVEILSEYDNFYKVNYNGINGYVKKNEVKPVSNTPSTPFPINIKIIIDSSCNLRSSPTIRSTTNNIITSIRSNESDITFIGRIFSDEAIDFGGTTWYYVNYQGEYGYIYNQYVRSITPIYENTEKSEFVSQTSELINPITHTPSLIIIIVMFIPCILILIILYNPRKQHKRIKQIRSKQPKEKY